MMQELSTPARAMLMAAATLMIGFSTLASNGVSDRHRSRALARGDLSLAWSAMTYITWPKESFPAPGASVVLAVLGEPSAALRELLKPYVDQSRRIQGRTVAVRYCGDKLDMTGCHVLFLTRTCSPALTESALKQALGLPILTLGETPEFAAAGGVLSVVPCERDSVLELNPRAARQQHLKVDARLVNLAVLVNEG